MNLIMNDLRKRVVDVLKNSDKALSLDDISEKLGVVVKSGTTNAMKACGLLKVVGSTMKPTKVKDDVFRFAFASDKPTNEKKIVINDKRKKVLEVLKASSEPLTMDAIATACKEEIKPGTFNGLLACGMVKKVDCVKKVRINPKGRKVDLYTLDTEKLKEFEK